MIKIADLMKLSDYEKKRKKLLKLRYKVEQAKKELSLRKKW